MTTIYYSMNNQLMSEYQSLINNPNSKEIPFGIESLEGMKAYIEDQGGGSLFYPTVSIRDYCVVDENDAKRISEIIKANSTTMLMTKLN